MRVCPGENCQVIGQQHSLFCAMMSWANLWLPSSANALAALALPKDSATHMNFFKNFFTLVIIVVSLVANIYVVMQHHSWFSLIF